MTDEIIVPASLDLSMNKGRFSEVERKCRNILSIYEQSCRPADFNLLTCLHNLARALEAQHKYEDGYKVRLRVRTLLSSLFGESILG